MQLIKSRFLLSVLCQLLLPASLVAQDTAPVVHTWYPGAYFDIEQTGTWGVGGRLPGPGSLLVDPAALSRLGGFSIRFQSSWLQPELEDGAGVGFAGDTDWIARSVGLGTRLGRFGGLALLAQRSEDERGDHLSDLLAVGVGAGLDVGPLGLEFGATYRYETQDLGESSYTLGHVGAGIALSVANRIRLAAHHAGFVEAINEMTDVLTRPDHIEFGAEATLVDTDEFRLTLFGHSTRYLVGRGYSPALAREAHYDESMAVRYGASLGIDWMTLGVGFGDDPWADASGLQVGLMLYPFGNVGIGGGYSAVSGDGITMTRFGGSLNLALAGQKKPGRTEDPVKIFNAAIEKNDLVAASKLIDDHTQNLDPETMRTMRTIVLIQELVDAGYCRLGAQYVPRIVQQGLRFPVVLEMLTIEDRCRPVSIASSEYRLEGWLRNDALVMARSPYLVQKDITVQSGGTLVIEAGVVLKFMPGTKLKLLPGSSLDIRGTTTHPVVFTSVYDDIYEDNNRDGTRSRPEPNDWLGITAVKHDELGEISASNLEVRYSATEPTIRGLFPQGVQFVGDLPPELQQRIQGIDTATPANER